MVRFITPKKEIGKKSARNVIVSHPSRKCGKDSLISRAKEKAREIMAESRKERQIRGTTNTHQKAFMPLFLSGSIHSTQTRKRDWARNWDE